MPLIFGSVAEGRVTDQDGLYLKHRTPTKPALNPLRSSKIYRAMLMQDTSTLWCLSQRLIILQLRRKEENQTVTVL
jgi:hypothetical protein